MTTDNNITEYQNKLISESSQHPNFCRGSHEVGAGKSLGKALYSTGQRFAERGGGTVAVHLANGDIHVIEASLDVVTPRLAD